MNDDRRRLDDYVEAYEVARASDVLPNLAEFTPAPGHPERFETVIELVRVDLEYGWQRGDRKGIDQYQQMFPDVLRSGDGLEQVAFEEFRLRRLAGEEVSKESYSQRFAISTDQWPDLPVGESGLSVSTLSYDDACLHELSQIDAQLGSQLSKAARSMPQVGDRFANFDLVGELGQGAFGRVFLARQDDLAHRFVALKITLHISEEPLRLAQLQHTNIVPIYSVHRRGPLQAICMPFLGPNTLADVLKTFELSRSIPNTGQAIVSTIAVRSASTIAHVETTDSELTATGNSAVAEGAPRCGESIRRLGSMDYLTATVWLISRTADGLAYAHDHGIVHRDLKPANILLTDDGEPLLLDFNLATQRNSTGTSIALIGGTLPYIGPEHMAALQHGGEVGPESDVYSLGVILYQMLTGRLPFPSPHGLFHEIVAQMRQERQQPAPSPRTLNPLITPGLEAIVQRCLAPNPKQRYAHARELQEDLQRHLEHRPLQHAPNRSISERFRKWTRRHPRFASATTVAMLASIIIIVLAVAAWTRNNRLAASNARETLRQIESDLETAQTVLNSPFVDHQELDHALHLTTETLNRLHVSEAPLERQPLFHQLDDARRQRLRQSTKELIYLAASGTAQQATREDADQGLFQEALRWNSLLTVGGDHRSATQGVLLQRAKILRAAEQLAEADQLEMQADALAHDSPDLRTLAYEYAQQRRYEDAATLLEELVRRTPQNHTLWFCLGSCHLSTERPADAEECYTKAIALRPKFALGYEHRGLARLQLQNYRAACDDFDAALAQHPNLGAALVNRAIALERLGKTELAHRDLCQAIELGLTQTRIYFIRSQLRSQLGDPVGAASDFQEGVRRTPQDELSWIARGVARLVEDPTQAMADFRQALELNPRSHSALQNIAHVQSERLGDIDGALETLTQLLQQEPQNASALAGRGVLFARQNQREASIKDAEAALKATDAPLVIYQAGCIFALNTKTHQPDRDRAIALIARALQRDTSLIDIASQDPDLDSLRDDNAFRELLAAARTLQQAGSVNAHSARTP